MIYILEDDMNITELITYSLKKSGFDAEGFSLPSRLYSAMERKMPELLILDVMLPEEDGLSVLSKIRASKGGAALPIIMLTAKGSEFDKVTALDLGADDYVTKPFGVMEFMARVRALIRRSKATEVSAERFYSHLGLNLSVERHELTADGVQVLLTFKEFELLVFLFDNIGRVLTRDRILREVWGYEFDGENRTVDVHVRTLRQKLGKYGEIIETVRGVGYKIAEKSRS